MANKTLGSRRVGRRAMIKSIAATAVAAPWVWPRRVSAAGQVIVRTPGGAYEEAMKKAVYDPFRQATGIEVVPTASTAAKLLAMFQSGNIEIDVIDAGDGPLITLGRMGALHQFDYAKDFKLTNPDHIDKAAKRKDHVGNIYFGSVLGYNTQAFPTGKHPRSWAEFWDLQKFPGPRMLADLASGTVNLEFALLADGVPKDKLYPIDMDRAFKSLDRIRPGIRKFWDTGALSAQMMADKEVVLGSIWNGRLTSVADKGAPLAIEWNEAMMQLQAFGIFKGAKNFENAKKLVDFAMQPKSLADFARQIPYGPCNAEAFKLLPPEIARNLPGHPEQAPKSFIMDVDWWETNRSVITQRWSQWLLRKG